MPKDLKKFVSVIDSFHLNVSRNEFHEYEKVLQKYPNMFHFYNSSNQSAAMTALRNCENNSLKYEELIKSGIFLGFDEKFDAILREKEDKKRIQGKVLVILMSKSWIGCSTSYDEKKRKISNIFRAFQTLFEIEQIRAILTCFVSQPIKIVFDFNRSSSQHLDPARIGDELNKGRP